MSEPRRPDRRQVLAGAGRVALRLGLGGALVAALASTFRRGPRRRPIEEAGTGVLRPPGALALDADFLATCIRCSLCAEACDTACIRLFDLGEGRHAGTPYIVAEARACNLCLACTEVCPSGALQIVRAPADVRMGVAVVDERLCVSHNGTGACGACHTVCPFRNAAITQGLFNAPTVHAERCVGCGLCEEACIVDDRKAIRVVTERSWS
jgi:ferredoxin-type protein NapG